MRSTPCACGNPRMPPAAYASVVDSSARPGELDVINGITLPAGALARPHAHLAHNRVMPDSPHPSSFPGDGAGLPPDQLVAVTIGEVAMVGLPDLAVQQDTPDRPLGGGAAPARPGRRVRVWPRKAPDSLARGASPPCLPQTRGLS